jgi:hypothetical protein
LAHAPHAENSHVIAEARPARRPGAVRSVPDRRAAPPRRHLMRPAPSEDGTGDEAAGDAIDDAGDHRSLVCAEPDGVGDEGKGVGEDAGGADDLEDLFELGGLVKGETAASNRTLLHFWLRGWTVGPPLLQLLMPLHFLGTAEFERAF